MKAARLFAALAASMLLALVLLSTVLAQTGEDEYWNAWRTVDGYQFRAGPYPSEQAARDTFAANITDYTWLGVRIDISIITNDESRVPADQWETVDLAHPSAPTQSSPTPTTVVVNKPPVITSPKEGTTFQVRTGETIDIPVKASDPEKKQLSYGLFQFPDGMTQDQQTGLITWEPDGRFIGELRQVTLGVRDEEYDNVVRRVIFVQVLPPLSTSTPSPTSTSTPTATPSPTPVPTPTATSEPEAKVTGPAPSVPSPAPTPSPTVTPTPESFAVIFPTPDPTAELAPILVELKQFRVELWTSINWDTGKIHGVQVLEKGWGRSKCGARGMHDWQNLESLYGIQIVNLPRIPQRTEEARAAGYNDCGTTAGPNIKAEELQTVIPRKIP